MARYLLIGLWIAHAVVVAREDGDRWLALTPSNGLPPPALELLSPAAGTVLRSSDGPELTLQLGLNVAVWCSDRNGSLNETNAGSMASGSEAAAALIEAESEWTCAKLSDMVLCLDAVSVTSSSTPARAPDSSDGEALQTIARQRCLPWDVAAVHSTIPTAHLPTGAFDLVARLIWAPFVELYEEDESDLASIANGNTSQSDREISNAVNKHRRNSNIVVNRDGTFEVHSGRSSRDAKARSSKSSDSSQVDSSNDGSCSSKNSKSLPGGVAVAKWESFSAPIAMNREAGWSTDEATALAQLFPLDDTSHSQKDDGTKSSSTSSSTSSGITSTSNSVSSNTAGLRLARTRHGPLLFNVRDLPAGVSLDTQGEWEESVVRLLCSVLRPGDFAVDVGAHLGSFTIPMAKRVSGGSGHSGRVLSFEPQADLYQALCANLALNGIFHVDARRAAVSSPDRAGATMTIPIRDPSRGASNFGGYSINYEEADYARQGFGFEDDASSRDSSSGRDSSGISSSSSSGSSSSSSSSSATSSSSSSQSHRDDSADNINPASSTTTFPIVTLDNVLSAEFNHRCPSLIKVDVEGEEEGVLKGLTRTLYKCRPVLYLENQCASKSKTLLAELTHQGYICWWDPAPYFSADNFRQMPLDQGRRQNPGVSLNILCLFEGYQIKYTNKCRHFAKEERGEAIVEEEVHKEEKPKLDDEKDEKDEKEEESRGKGSRTNSSNRRRGDFPTESILSRWRENWQALADVTRQLQRINPNQPLVEEYTPLNFRRDVGGLGPGVSGLAMANC